MTQEAIHVKNLKVINDIGQLAYTYSRFALISRQFQISRTKHIKDFDTANSLNSSIYKALVLQDSLLINYNS